MDAVRSESEPAWWEGPMRITWSIEHRKKFFYSIMMENTCELYSTLGQRETTHSKVVSDLLKAPPEPPGHAHHCLHIVADGEPFSQPFEEGFFSRGEGQGGEEFEEITKVVAADRQ